MVVRACSCVARHACASPAPLLARAVARRSYGYGNVNDDHTHPPRQACRRRRPYPYPPTLFDGPLPYPTQAKPQTQAQTHPRLLSSVLRLPSFWSASCPHAPRVLGKVALGTRHTIALGDSLGTDAHHSSATAVTATSASSRAHRLAGPRPKDPTMLVCGHAMHAL